MSGRALPFPRREDFHGRLFLRKLQGDRRLPRGVHPARSIHTGSIIDESGNARQLEFAWQVIDSDPDFAFPDHAGEVITVQDCWISRDRPEVQACVRSLLHKMGYTVLEAPGNGAGCTFCTTALTEPSASNSKLAPERWLEKGGSVVRPMPEAEADEVLRTHCNQIQTEEVACYCKFCADGIRRGGKTPRHLIELLFG